MFLFCVFLTGALAQSLFGVPRCPTSLGGTPQSISGNIQQGKCVGICTYTCNGQACSITVSVGEDQVSCGAPPSPTTAGGTGVVPTSAPAFVCPAKFPGTGKLLQPNCYECGSQYCYLDGSTIYCVPDGCADPSGAFCPQIPNQPAYTKPYKINPTSCLASGCTFCCTALYFCTQTADGYVSCNGAQPGQCDTGVATSSPTTGGGVVPTSAPVGTPPPCGSLVPCTGQSALTCTRSSGCPPTLTPACTCCSSDQSIKVVDCVDNSVPTTPSTTVATAAPPPQCGVTSPCASCSHSCSVGFKATCLCCSNSAVTIPPRCDPITIATLEPCDSSKQLACNAVARCTSGQTASCLCDDADEIQKTSCLDVGITSPSVSPSPSPVGGPQTTLASLAPITRASTPMAQTRACDPSLQPYCEANSLKACKQMGYESICKCTGSGVIVDKQCGSALAQSMGGSCPAKVACEQQNQPMCAAPAKPLCTCGANGDVTGYSCIDGNDMSDASLVALASAIVVGCLSLLAL